LEDYVVIRHSVAADCAATSGGHEAGSLSSDDDIQHCGQSQSSVAEYQVTSLSLLAFHLALLYHRTKLQHRPSQLHRPSTNSHLLLFLPVLSLLLPLELFAFCVSSPNDWNSVPLHIRSSDSLATFQSRLKSHLFASAYHV